MAGGTRIFQTAAGWKKIYLTALNKIVYMTGGTKIVTMKGRAKFFQYDIFYKTAATTNQ